MDANIQHGVSQDNKEPIKPPGRQQDFYDLIKDAGLGPFTGTRNRVLQNLSRELVEPVELKIAIRNAIVEAGEAVTNRQLQAAITKLVLKAGVALEANGDSIAYTRKGKRTLFSKLSPDWEVKTECELVLTVLRESSFTEEDLPHLAFAIYGGRGEAAIECEDLLEMRLDKLIDEQLVDVDQEAGTYMLKSSNGHVVAPPLRAIRSS